MTIQPLPIHTVKARWGSAPSPEDNWPGYAPDWKVHWVQDSGDAVFPYYVRVTYRAKPGDTNPCTWLVPSIDDARYDLTEAVYLPRLQA
jgi:hypothetical protein